MLGSLETGILTPRFVSLVACLFAFWMILSGFFKPFLMTAGLLCSIGCALLARRVQSVDEEGHPSHLAKAALTYFPWLAWEICKSAWSVTKIIIDPRLPISPTMTIVEAGQKTVVGIVTYANSITLTPGTITCAVDGNQLLIHALVREGAIDLEGGGMDARVSRFEGTA